MRRSLAACMFAAALFVGLTAANAGVAHAAVHQNGSSACTQAPGPTPCNGKSPYDNGCTDGKAIMTKDIYTFFNSPSDYGVKLGHIDLYWSTRCQANWAETVPVDCGFIQTSVVALYVNAPSQYYARYDGRCRHVVSSMFYAPYEGVGACGQIISNHHTYAATLRQTGFTLPIVCD